MPVLPIGLMVRVYLVWVPHTAIGARASKCCGSETSPCEQLLPKRISEHRENSLRFSRSILPSRQAFCNREEASQAKQSDGKQPDHGCVRPLRPS